MLCLSRGGTVLKKLFLGWGGCQSAHGISLARIAFLSFRLAGYFTAKAGGGGGGGAIPAELYTLLRGGRFKASCDSSVCIIQS